MNIVLTYILLCLTISAIEIPQKERFLLMFVDLDNPRIDSLMVSFRSSAANQEALQRTMDVVKTTLKMALNGADPIHESPISSDNIDRPIAHGSLSYNLVSVNGVYNPAQLTVLLNQAFANHALTSVADNIVAHDLKPLPGANFRFIAVNAL